MSRLAKPQVIVEGPLLHPCIRSIPRGTLGRRNATKGLIGCEVCERACGSISCLCMQTVCAMTVMALIFTFNLAGRQPRTLSKKNNNEVEGVASIQLAHQSSSPPSTNEAPKEGYLCQRCASKGDTVHQIVSSYCSLMQLEQATPSASSPVESPYSQHSCMAAAPPAVMDPCSVPADEDSSFWTWLQSQVEALPQEALSSFQLEDILSASMEEDCRQEDSVNHCLCSEHQEAVSALAPRPVPLQVEASLLIAKDFEVLGSPESFSSVPLWHMLTEAGTDRVSSSTAASYC